MSVPPPPAAPGGQPAPFGNQPPAGNQGAPGAFGPPPGQAGQPGQFGPPPGQPAGAPPAFPPPGQPGQPGAFGPPPGQPFGPPPGQPAQKRRFPVWLMIVIPIVVIGVVIGAVVGFMKSPASASVGDCLQVTEFTTNGDEPTKIDCGDQNANVKIAVKLDNASDNCPTGDYDEYSVSGRGDYKLCLMINAHDGDCFANVTSSTDGYKRVPCTDPTAEIEFLKIVAGQADQAACEGLEIDGAVTYSEPATTMCAVAKNGASA
ncbi:hypothetical protein GCM10017786_74850 [Amycolatopsis deserti]|uniref:Uncharacterized protein n=1 Tax=Amycolatopsis deserti TaxID=185696 RepID=A0ABQ3JHN4_9PSEU|nr:hypothetical protein [Amycolatopsis deserti]GHF29866.1 hypothetical protein GCM10017786_74850 [Amycolatopsis deserti]